jgi:glucose-1-phosphate thymidylyltransferase
MLNFHSNDKLELISNNIKLINSNIIEPVFIADNVVIQNSTVGPHVSIYKESHISDSKLENSIIGERTEILNANIKDSMIGNNCKYNGNYKSVNIGDFSELI